MKDDEGSMQTRLSGMQEVMDKMLLDVYSQLNDIKQRLCYIEENLKSDNKKSKIF